MIKKLLAFLFELTPKRFQQRVVEYYIRRAMAEKRRAVETLQRKSGYNIFIETGTFLGDMVEGQKKNFKKIYSIGLQKELAEKAKKRFSNDNHITIFQGDSSSMLNVVLDEVREPAIFWLDAHYSGGLTAKGERDCPIYAEVDAVMNKNKNHLLLIDDARLFTGEGDYPRIEDLTTFILSKDSRYKVLIENDIISYTL